MVHGMAASLKKLIVTLVELTEYIHVWMYTTQVILMLLYYFAWYVIIMHYCITLVMEIVDMI